MIFSGRSHGSMYIASCSDLYICLEKLWIGQKILPKHKERPLEVTETMYTCTPDPSIKEYRCVDLAGNGGEYRICTLNGEEYRNVRPWLSIKLSKDEWKEIDRISGLYVEAVEKIQEDIIVEHPQH